MTLASDTRGLLCGRCKYDLSATPLDGLCPECGHPVRVSWNGMLETVLRQLHKFRRWFSTVTTCTLIMGIITVVSGVSSLVVAVLMAFVPRDWNGWMANTISMSVAGCASGLVGLLWLIGWLVLAQGRVSEPWPELKPKGKRIQIAIIVSIASGFLVMPISATMQGELHVAFLLQAVFAIMSLWLYAVVLEYCETLGRALRPAVVLPTALKWLNLLVLVASLVTSALQVYDRTTPLPGTPAATTMNFSEMLLPASSLAAASQGVSVLTLALFMLMQARVMRRMTDAIPTTVLDYRKAKGYEPEGDSVWLPDST